MSAVGDLIKQRNKLTMHMIARRARRINRRHRNEGKRWVTTYPNGHMEAIKTAASKRVLKSYKEAEEYTGIPEKRLRRMVARRSIRVIKETRGTVYFIAEHLMKDLEDLELPKFF